MLTVRSTPGQVEIAGSRADLIHLKDQIGRWLEACRESLSINADPQCRSAPYLKSFAELTFQKADGRIIIKDNGRSLQIVGSPQHLLALLWVFDISPNATTGHHQHFYEHPDLDPDSPELIAMVREQTHAANSD